ncbi:plasmid stability protein [Nocardiopsis mwathae]|uniref:Plasmid stability protein n=1 Tax=Nocardiopsis mwathae TaxID=1472723 RepID=A0A7X0D4X3_9ACTN|nr:antitoxin [Nocardiopsis mwathae]MBB6170509.1 plasmid stability protein [Nocardiopsis mwathae]
MPDVTIRRVPESALRTLKIRAAKSGKSLQSYLLELVEKDASVPTNAEIAQRMEQHASIELSAQDVTDVIDEMRSSR